MKFEATTYFIRDFHFGPLTFNPTLRSKKYAIGCRFRLKKDLIMQKNKIKSRIKLKILKQSAILIHKIHCKKATIATIEMVFVNSHEPFFLTR